MFGPFMFKALADAGPSLEEIVHNYGLLGLILFVVLRELAPWVINRWWPEKAAERKRRQQVFIKAEEARLKEQADDRADNRRRLQLLDERNTQAWERLASATEASRLLLELISANMANLLEESRYTRNGVTALLTAHQIPHSTADPVYTSKDKTKPTIRKRRLPDDQN